MTKFDELQEKLRVEGKRPTDLLLAILDCIGEQEARLQHLEVKAGVREKPGPRQGDELKQICSCTGCERNLVYGRYGPTCECCEWDSPSGCGAEQYNRHCTDCTCERCKPHQLTTSASFFGGSDG